MSAQTKVLGETLSGSRLAPPLSHSTSKLFRALPNVSLCQLNLQTVTDWWCVCNTNGKKKYVRQCNNSISYCMVHSGLSGHRITLFTHTKKSWVVRVNWQWEITISLARCRDEDLSPFLRFLSNTASLFTLIHSILIHCVFVAVFSLTPSCNLNSWLNSYCWLDTHFAILKRSSNTRHIFII